MAIGMTSRTVYFDEGRASSWIDRRWAEKISAFFENEGFQKMNAIELRDWFADSLKREDPADQVVVFSQDLVPDTVMSPGSSNNLMRYFLDKGGRAVWIGDIPFWTISLPASKNGPDRQEVWQHGTHHAMLYVEPLIAESSSVSCWAPDWDRGLGSHWYSQRPVDVEVGSTGPFVQSHGGARVEVIAYADVTLLPTAGNALTITRWKKSGKKVGSIGLGSAGFSGNVSWTEQFPKELSFKPLKLACAWRVVFNQHERGGFYRLWDCGTTLQEPPKSLLDDMLALSTA